MKALTYLLRLHEPVLATQTASGESNSATASPYVPGSMVRGAVLARLFPGQPLDPAKTHRQFFDGQVCFLNAYPAHEAESDDYVRLLPAPLSWRVDKYPSASWPENVLDLAHTSATEESGLRRPKQFSSEDRPRFVIPDLTAGQALWRSPRQQLAVHNASDDRNEKQATKSQVYRYEAIAAGEVLAGVVLGPDAVLQQLKANLQQNAPVMLGGSRTGGYGLASFDQVAIDDDWREYEDSLPAPSSGRLTFTLLSDVIARQPTGGFANSLDDLLGATAKQAFVEMKIVGGFNRKWGLPLQQLWAMAAGSVFVYEVSEADAQTIRDRAAAGLGERRADGFGRVAVNWHTAAQYSAGELKEPDPEQTELTEEARAIAQRMANGQWRAQLETALVKKVVSVSLSSLPSPAQMARVRLAARQALFAKNQTALTPVVEHLKSLFDEETKRPKRGAQQLGEAFVDGKSMLTWLRERAQKPEIAYLTDATPTRVAGVSASPDPGLAAEYTARLIDGVMKRAIQIKKARGG
jgi:CRISPR-associated protein Csx10